MSELDLMMDIQTNSQLRIQLNNGEELMVSIEKIAIEIWRSQSILGIMARAKIESIAISTRLTVVTNKKERLIVQLGELPLLGTERNGFIIVSTTPEIKERVWIAKETTQKVRVSI